MQRFMQEIPGAYSGILMTKKRTFFMRDPHGIRPFLVGRTEDGMIVAASESCVFPILKASLIFEVERGSIVEITDDGTMTVHAYPGVLPKHSAHCVVCLAYFARPDSHVFIDGKNPADVHQKGSYAYRFGVELAVEHPVKADFVASIRNSGDLATKGYSKRSGLPDKELLIRNFSIPRTFLASEQEEREFMVMLKFGLMTDMFRDADMRRVCLIDDTIIRATTMRGIVSLLRAGGAEEVHIRTAFPPITNPCFMGIAMPTRAELVASSRTIEEIKDFIQADSLGYLSIDGLSRAMVERNDSLQNYCTACFTGHYPIPVTA
jgi:amidophosphoribosyltransferase